MCVWGGVCVCVCPKCASKYAKFENYFCWKPI